MLLQRIEWYAAEKRTALLESGALVRIYVFTRRLPMMHRLGWQGRKNSSQTTYAWFVWDADHPGNTVIRRIDWQPVQIRGAS
jgi:hypothetical protein